MRIGLKQLFIWYTSPGLAITMVGPSPGLAAPLGLAVDLPGLTAPMAQLAIPPGLLPLWLPHPGLAPLGCPPPFWLPPGLAIKSNNNT